MPGPTVFSHPIMNIVVEKQPKCAATLRVEIPAEKVQGRRDAIVRSLSGKARIQGFRPGKAPLAVVEKRLGKQITEELEESLLNEAFDQALKTENLKVLDFGTAENLTYLPDGGVSFESRLTLAPEVTLPEYKGIKVSVPPADVPDEEVQEQLKALRERLAEFKKIEDRPAANGDFAVIDYTSTVDGQPTEEFLGKPAGYIAGREGFWVRLDEKAFLPGFAAQLEGMKPGDSREISVTLPEDFPLTGLAGREVRFATTLKELQEAVLPELDDALAARLAPGKTMDEVTAIIRDNMLEERRRRISDMKVNQIVAHFNALADFELPEPLVAQETQSQVDSMVERGVEAGMAEEELQAQQQEIFASAGHQAVTNLRTNFILQEIVLAEKITVTDNELINHLAQVAISRKVAPKKFIKDLSRAGRLPSIRSSLAIGKAIDFLVEHAEVVESTETPAEDA